MSTPSQPSRRDDDRQTTPQENAPVDQSQPVLPMQDENMARERSTTPQSAGAAERQRPNPKQGEPRRGNGLDEKFPSRNASARRDSDDSATDEDRSDVDRNL
jgi:hypothetical protein